MALCVRCSSEIQVAITPPGETCGLTTASNACANPGTDGVPPSSDWTAVGLLASALWNAVVSNVSLPLIESWLGSPAPLAAPVEMPICDSSLNPLVDPYAPET